MPRQRVPGRGWARFGFGLGIVVSVAANIAHSYVPPKGAPDGWHPNPGAIIAAAWWPVALVVSIEVISRVQWPRRWYWIALRFGGAAMVAAVAAVISYKHLHGLVRSYGEDQLSAAIGPLAVDGLMVVCSAALLAMSTKRREPEPGPEFIFDPEPEPAGEPPETETADPEPAPRRKASRRRAWRRDRPETPALVRSAHEREPTATNARIAQLAGVSLASVKRHRPPRPAVPEPAPEPQPEPELCPEGA